MNRLLFESKARGKSFDELRQHLESVLQVHFNRFPENVLAFDCDIDGVKSGNARDIKVSVVDIRTAQERLSLTVDLLYPCKGVAELRPAVRHVDIDRIRGGITVTRHTE